jgi:hypothetical protein
MPSFFGSTNPFPLKFGGGPSDWQKTHAALRTMVGPKNVGPEDGIEDSWRQARARGLAALASFDERAAMQAFPDNATDHLPVYEQILRLAPPADASDEERRRTYLALWTRLIDATIPSLESELQAIDSRFSIVDISTYIPTQNRVTQAGRTVEPYSELAADPNNPPFSPSFGRSGTQFPNYADSYRVHVQFGVPNGTYPDAVMLDAMRRATDLLNERLPAWCAWNIFFEDGSNPGFFCDLSLLNLASLGLT